MAKIDFGRGGSKVKESKSIVLCIKSCQDELCIFEQCPMYPQCFPPDVGHPTFESVDRLVQDGFHFDKERNG